MSTKVRCGDRSGLDSAPRLLEIASRAVIEAGADAVAEQHVDRRLRAWRRRGGRPRRAAAADGPSGSGAHWPRPCRGRDGAADEGQADRLELCGRKRLGGEPAQKLWRSPETMAKPAMPAVADEVENLGPLDIGAPVIAAAEAGVAGARPGLAPGPRAGSAGRRASRACRANCPRSSRSRVDLRSRSLNQAFCSAPRIVCGGSSLRGFGMRRRRRRSSAGGRPPS